jgi:hypothetical protein
MVYCIISIDLRSPRLPLLILVSLLPLHCLQDIRDVTDVPVEKQAARASADSTDTDQKMDQGPAKSDSTTGVGLVSNAAPLTVSSNHHFSSWAVVKAWPQGAALFLKQLLRNRLTVLHGPAHDLHASLVRDSEPPRVS